MHKYKLSIIVLVDDAYHQAVKTLQTLSTTYQRQIDYDDYEIVVVEQESEHNLTESELQVLPGHFRYFRQKGDTRPISASLNLALSKCRGQMIGLLLDARCMVTPGVIHNVLMARRINPQALVAVPGYDLVKNVSGYWPGDGYRLFESAAFDSGGTDGYLEPMTAPGAMFCERTNIKLANLTADNTVTGLRKYIKKVDALFGNQTTGENKSLRSLEARIYHTIGSLPESRIFVLPGEGTFRQFHGQAPPEVVATTEPLIRKPFLLGKVHRCAHPFLQQSCRQTMQQSEDVDPPPIRLSSNRANPVLSIIVIVYDMALQAMNTLYSLSSRYQQHVSGEEYEVIVVENTSRHNLDPVVVETLGANFRYFLRDESGVSPAAAINFAFQQCRGSYVGLMIDGARILTPRVVQYALTAGRLNPRSMVVTPSYHLSAAEQHTVSPDDYNETIEQQRLAHIRWKENGYRLFDAACMGAAHRFGYLSPPMESNCFFGAYSDFERIGFADERFNLRGGGALNLHMFRSLGLLPRIPYFVLIGEGSFHQLHGGVTTYNSEEHDTIVESFRDQLQVIWNDEFHGLRRDPILFGAVTDPARRFLLYSSQRCERRLLRFYRKKEDLWEDDHLQISIEQSSVSAT